MKNWKWFPVLVGVVLAGCIVLFWCLTFDKKQDQGTLPIINISLNGVELATIDEGTKDAKYFGNEVKIHDAAGERSYSDVELKGRGNWTWAGDKKPYQLKFADKVELGGMGKAKKWYLLANYADQTHLRTDIGFKLAEMLSMSPALRGQYVELYVDNDYRGLYYLTHAVEISKHSVDLKDPMGVLVELDNIYGSLEPQYFSTSKGDRLVVKDAVDDEHIGAAMAEFLKDFNEMELAIEARDYARLAAVTDIKSLAEYYLLSEFIINPDAYWTSFYFYKDGAGDKIHAGPAWDFDVALANRAWGNWLGEKLYSPREIMVRRNELLPPDEYTERGIEQWYDASQNISQLMFEAVKIPEFWEEICQIYQEKLSGRSRELVTDILRRAEEIREGVEKDQAKWYPEKENYDEELSEMLQWILERYEFFEEIYGDNTNSGTNQDMV